MLTIASEQTDVGWVSGNVGMGLQQQPRPRTIADQFRWFAGITQAIEYRKQEFWQFLGTIILQNMGASAPTFKPLVSTAGAELAVQGIQTVHTGLQEARSQIIASVVNDIVHILDSLVAQRQVGLIQWFSPTIARFSYYTATHEDRVARQYIQGNQRITEKERTHIHRMHIHDIIEAKSYVPPVKNVPMPERGVNIMNALPLWLHSSVRVVVGDEIATNTVEIDRKKEIIRESETLPQPVFRPDPCIILGKYVLCGWTLDEVGRRVSFRQA